MADFGSALWNKPASVEGGGSGESGDAPSNPVTRSLRFDKTASLYRATGSTDTTWTVSMWVKRAELGVNQYIFSWGGDGVRFDSYDRISVYNGGSYRYTTAVFGDASSWYNIVLSCSSGTLTVIVNGTTHALSSSTTYAALANVYFGKWSNNSYYNYDGYLADIYGIEGSALDHTSFTESNGYGGLKPKAYTGSFGTNGFHIDAQPAHDAELLVTSIDRNDGDTQFADSAAGRTVSSFGDPEHSTTVGNPFDSSGTAISFDGTGDYLSVATSSDFDFGSGSYTYEGWFYFNSFSESPTGIFSRNTSSSPQWSVCTNSDGTLQFYESVNDSYNTSTFTFSTGQWYHIALCKNGTTYKVYVDGSEKISATLSSAPDANLPLLIGRFYDNYNGYYLDGYCFDFRAQKGVDTGGSEPSAAFELNPVYIGGDQSGNKNHFTPTNISGHDVMPDVPYPKNYATLNPLQKAGTNGNDPDEGNLSLVGGSNPSKAFSSTIAVNSGKYYAEFYLESLGYPSVSVSDTSLWVNNYGSGRVEGNGSITYDVRAATGSGQYFINSTSGGSALSITPSAGDIIQVAFDADTRKVWFGRNGTWNGSGTPINGQNNVGVVGGTDALTIVLRSESGTTVANFGQDPTFEGNKTSGQNTSQSEFYYAPPSGYKSLNASNLGTPTVNPEEYFSAKTYTGAGGSEEINLGFTPDLIWIKRREDSGYWHGLYDSARGLSAGALASNSTNSEDTTQRVASFDSNAGSEGFTLSSSHYSYTNTSGKGFVSWNWKESASAGFDIVTYEGNSEYEDDTQNISHSLGVAPEMIIIKARDGRAYEDYYAEDNWYVWHKGLTSGSSINLNYSTGEVDYSSSSTEPIGSVNSSTFTVCNSVDYEDYYYDFTNWGDPDNSYTGDNERYVAYVFSGVEGFSKFGTYRGAGNDGVFVYTGHRPKMVWIKNIDTTGNWFMFDAARDTSNETVNYLQANNSTAESTNSGYKIDILSNGFKINVESTHMNNSAYDYLFCSWAEQPFAAPSNAR